METRDLAKEWAIQASIAGVKHPYLKDTPTNEKLEKLYNPYEKANMYPEIEEMGQASAPHPIPSQVQLS